MFAKLKEKTPTVGAQRSPMSNQDKTKLKATGEEHLQSINETGVTSPDSRATLSIPGKISRQSSVSSLVSELSMVSTSQFINDSPMPNIDSDIGTFDLEEGTFPQLSSDLSPQDIYSSLVRESRQKLNTAKFKYQDLLNAYRELEKQNAKIKDALAKSQDRAFKKIAEVKENEKLVRLELDKCQQRLSALEQEKMQNEKPQEEVDAQQARIAELEAELATRTNEEASAKVNTDRLSNLITSLQSEKNKIEDGLKLATEKAMELKKQLTEKETIHSLAIAECKRNFHTLLEERDAEIKNCRLQIEHVRTETEAAKKHAQELSVVIASLKSENSTIKESLESTEKRLEAEKIQLVQEVSKAKDAACEALQDEFERKLEDRRKNWERESEKKMHEYEASCHQKNSEAQEQLKLALEESWLSNKAADSKHEEEMEVVQTRISQLSVELDSARMTLHRRTVEADQLRAAQEQLSMQATADIEQSVSQCRREMETQHREEMKKLREEFENQQKDSQSDEAKLLADRRAEVESAWSRVKSEFGTDTQLPEVTTHSEIVEFLIQNSNALSRSKVEVERNVRAECEKATEDARVPLEKEIQTLRSEKALLDQKLVEQSCQIQSLENQEKQIKSELAEFESLRKQLDEANSRLQFMVTHNGENEQNGEVNFLRSSIDSMNQQLLEKNNQIQLLDSQCERLKNDLKQVDSLLASNEDLKQQLNEKNSHIQVLETRNVDTVNALKTFQENFDSLNQQVAQKDDQIRSLNERCQQFERDLEEVRNSNGSLQQQLAERVTQIQELEIQNGEQSKLEFAEMDSLRSANVSLNEELAQKNEQIQSMDGQRQQLKKDLEDVFRLRGCNDDLERQLAEKTTQFQALEDQNFQLKSEFDAAKAEIEGECKKLSEIVPANIVGLGNIVSSVMESYALLKENFESVNGEQISVESFRIELQEANTRNEERIRSLTEELNDCKSKLDDEAKQSAQLKQALEAKESANHSRITELENLLQTLSNDSRSLEHMLTKTNEQLETERSKTSAAAEESRKLSEQIEILRKEKEMVLAENAQREKLWAEERNRIIEEAKTSSIEIRRLETKLTVLESEIAEAKTANQAADGRYQDEVLQASKKSEDLKGKCATLEMDLVESRQKMSLSQELVGKLKAELDSSRKVTEEAQQRYAALKTQSAKRLKLLGDEKCELEKQLASSLAENDQLKLSLASANEKTGDPSEPSVSELQQTITDLTTRIDVVTRTVADKEIRIAELELEFSDSAAKHEAETKRIQVEREKAQAEVEQRIRFEMKRTVGEFERLISERDKQIAKLTVAESSRSGVIDTERQLRQLERELSEKNAAVEQLVVMYEKQLRDQAADLRQEANTRMQSQSEKHQSEVDGLMEEFRNETKQWVIERQRMNDEIEQCRKDREQMVQELKRLSDLLDSARIAGPGSPARNGRSTKDFESPYFTPNQSSVLAGTTSPGLTSGMALQLHEATEYEYLRNILLEYMLGRETNVLYRVIGTIMRFSDDQMTEIAAREDSRSSKWL